MIEKLACSTWAEFKALLADDIYASNPARRRAFLFRGHGNSAWQLSPSFDRAFIDFHDRDRNDLEKKLMKEFRNECEAEVKYKDILRDDLQTLALAQHYGLPTRLLDWTESPYVAAFFAFQGHFQDSMFGRPLGDTVAIWILNPKSHIWTESFGVQLLSPAAWDNERLSKQAGWFTLSRTPARSLIEYVEQCRDAEDALKLIEMPSSEARIAIPDLDLMGINHANLFSDLEAKSRSSVTRALLKFNQSTSGN